VTLETVVAPRMAQAARDRGQEFKNLQSDFADRVKQRTFHDYRWLPATLLTVQSSVADDLEYDGLYEQVQAAGRNARPSEEAIHWSDGLQTAELATNGVLLHAYGGVYESFKRAYQSRMILHAREHPEGPVPFFLPSVPLQKNIVSHAFEQCQLLTALRLPLPWFVGVSVVGARGFSLITESEQSPKTIDADELHFGPVRITPSDQVADRVATGGCLHDLLNRLCRHVGWDCSECFTEPGRRGRWNRRFLRDSG
jgi:hypothetical protein